MPKWIAVEEYHTSTSVESSAAMPSRGMNCEKPVRSAACFHCGSSRVPSIRSDTSSSRGGLTSSWFCRPLRISPMAGLPTGSVTAIDSAAASRKESGAIERRRVVRLAARGEISIRPDGHGARASMLDRGATPALNDFAPHPRDSRGSARTMNVLLVDAEDVTVIAECGSGAAAIESLRTHQVDLVFLDIQMPGVDGFVVAESLQGPEAPLLVFVTAHDNHAIRAFEARALDYLLKPVRKERLALALDRAREAIAGRRSTAYARQLRSVIAQLDREPTSPAPSASVTSAAERIEVRDGERVRFVATADVAWAEAKGPHVLLHTKDGVFEIRDTLARLEASLDARRFVRIHRSYIVNLGQMKELRPWFGGDALLVLHDGQQLKVSRTYRAQLRQRLNAV